MSDLFRDSTLDVLLRTLDADALNHLLISNNIANVNTPGYKRAEVSFKDQLKEILRDRKLKGVRTHPMHLPIGAPSSLEEMIPRILTEDDTSMRADQNNVDIDKEMAKLAANSLEYNAVTRLVSQRFLLLQAAIEGR